LFHFYLFVLIRTQEELAKLRESHVGLQVKVESTQAKLERVTLQLDGAQTTSAELARQNDELKRANGDIKRQLDKWQNLETKGGEEVETLRKQRIDLEVEVRALQLRLEKKESELQKEKNKVIKHKKNAEEFEVRRCFLVFIHLVEGCHRLTLTSDVKRWKISKISLPTPKTKSKHFNLSLMLSGRQDPYHP
jgi:septal ring factor EnvC (AmiA/AmiB activator)